MVAGAGRCAEAVMNDITAKRTVLKNVLVIFIIVTIRYFKKHPKLLQILHMCKCVELKQGNRIKNVCPKDDIYNRRLSKARPVDRTLSGLCL